MKTIYTALTEAGFSVNRSDFFRLNEEAKIQVSDAVMTEMFKFITDKYNALDFKEIEHSAGDVRKFKYKDLILQNCDTIDNIYTNSADAGAKKYLEVTAAVRKVYDYLEADHEIISTMYKMNNGFVQLIYTSMVASTIYAVSALVTNTIRFVTTEQDSDMQVLFDEIPNSMKNVHIKNVLSAAANTDDIHKAVTLLYNQRKGGNPQVVTETVSGIVVGGLLVVAGIILLIPKILVMVREIIYTVYYTRVKIASMLDLQVQLIRTNVESLEAGRGNKKIIARQVGIANKLEKMKDKLAVNMDAAGSLASVQKKHEDASLHIDRNSPLVADAGTSELML